MKQWSRLLVLALVVALAACADQGPPTPDVTPRVTDQVISCRVTVASRAFACDNLGPASPGLSLSVVGGPQGKYVRITSGTPSFVAGTPGTFSAPVQLSNHTVQAMGSTDGTAVDTGGIKVFFSQLPAVTSGTGTVTVTGDGTGTFTSAGQPYYKYNQLLAADSTVYTANKTWNFSITGAVNQFDFKVMVAARFPADSGILLIDSVNPGTSVDLSGVSAAGSSVWVVGATGTIRRLNGGAWAAQSSGHGAGVAIRGIEMRSNGPANTERGVAVGDSGLILYYNGTNWVDAVPAGSGTLLSVTRVNGSGGGGGLGAQWYACGSGGFIMHTRDSTGATGWAQENSMSGKDLHICGGNDTSSVFAIGDDGVIEHRSGGSDVAAWDTTGYRSGTTQELFAATGGSAGLFLAGAGGTIRLVNPFPPTPPFTATSFTSPTVNTIYGAQNDLSTYMVGANGTVLLLNDEGTAFGILPSNTTTNLNGVTTNLQCAPGGCGNGEIEHIWVAGNGGLVLHGHR